MFFLNQQLRMFLLSLTALAMITACTQGVGHSRAASQGGVQSTSVSSPQQLDPKAVELLESKITVKIPEESFAAVNPEELRTVDEVSLNKLVMPVIAGLRFFSHEKQRDV